MQKELIKLRCEISQLRRKKDNFNNVSNKILQEKALVVIAFRTRDTLFA
jgi:hypothetical protein